MASTTKENILIFGATGYIGWYITDQIVKAKTSFGRIAIFTSPGTVEKKPDLISQLQENGVEVIVGSAGEEADVVNALDGITTIVSAVGQAVIADQLKLIKLAEKVPSVKRFFPSEYGTDIEYNETSAKEPPHQQKLKVRAALKEVSYLDHTYVVLGKPYADGASNGTFFGIVPFAPEIGGFNVKEKKAVLTGDGTGKISLTTLADYDSKYRNSH
ncbi:hypothetical protein HYALB_00002401 [Hymenoscyphus albidus]|uniref:NmrA-like domain-containing protein n=1 Tax=Hymenoscyphus albidus TaxID=595503 RepID=A0A9N9LP59_9HELO|nr:hypothetical protein HYALB_00002401 [Hymenoscyphus albidus]